MMVSISFIIGLLCAYWVIQDSRSRKSDFGSILVWSLGTILAWYLFVPMYLIFGRKKKKKSSQPEDDVIDVEATAVEETLTCPHCGKQAKVGYKHCPYCGKMLRPVCEHCGREVDQYWRTCPYCHEPLSFSE